MGILCPAPWVFDSINRRERCGEDENAEEEESDGDEIESDEGDDEDVSKEKEDEESSMGVKVGTMTKLDDDHDKKMLEDEEYKLRVMMIKKKHRGLYRSMMRN